MKRAAILRPMHIIALCGALAAASTATASDCEIAGGGVFDNEGFTSGDMTPADSCGGGAARFSGAIDGDTCTYGATITGNWTVDLPDGSHFETVEFTNAYYRDEGLDIIDFWGIGLYEEEYVAFRLFFEGTAGARGTDLEYLVVNAEDLDGNVVLDARGVVRGGSVTMVVP